MVSMHDLPPPELSRPSVRQERGHGRFAPLLEQGENVLWFKRPLAPRIAEALEEVAKGNVFVSEAALDVVDLDLSGLLQPVSNPVAKEFLTEDIASNLQDLAGALGQRHLFGKLAVVTDDACRKYHTDYVTVRLICTYAGLGTEWVKNDDVLRENLCRTDVSLEMANRSVLRHPDAVNHCGTGDVLLLKGEAFEGNRGLGAVHRSPPIAEKSLRRLVFRVDVQRCC